MSRTTDFDFHFTARLDIAAVVYALQSEGFTFAYEGRMSYVIDTDQKFNWQQIAARDALEVVGLLRGCDPAETAFGITMFLDEGHGGDLLFHPGWQVVSFMAEVHRRVRPGRSIADLSWYLDRLLPPFEQWGMVGVEARDVA